MTANDIPAVQNAESFIGQVRATLNTTDVAQQVLISVSAAVAAAYVVAKVSN